MIDFVRLTTIDPAVVQVLLNEPRNARHLPLAGPMDEAATISWIAAKDGQWAEHGYGPWAILVDGVFAGWGGFQHEPNGADFALVLGPEHWGTGERITRAALQHGFTELGLESVIIALPRSRNPTRVVARLGFVPDGEVEYGGTTFAQYRLTRTAWDTASVSPA